MNAKPMVLLGDGLAGLATLDPSTVALLCSDLPSGETRAPFDVPPKLVAFWPAVWRVMRADGIVVVMASSLRFAAALIASQSRRFRYDLIWHKSLATGHLNAKHRPLRAHEFLLVFASGKGVYHPQMLQGASPIHAARRSHHGENYGAMTQPSISRAGATDRYPTSVLEFASVGTSAQRRTHPQQKQQPLLEWIVRTYTTPGDLVVDPYAGSGSTGQAALKLGRRFLGWDVCSRFGSPIA